MDETFKTAAGALEESGVRFLLGGGFAVNVHGFERGTKDIDLLVSEMDRDRANDALLGVGFTALRSVDIVTRYQPPSGILLVVDILPLDPKTFDAMWADGLDRHMAGSKVRVVGIDHLLAMKLHAMKHDNMVRGLKDLLDIAALARANNLAPDSDRLRDLCLQFGSQSILESVRKALQDA